MSILTLDNCEYSTDILAQAGWVSSSSSSSDICTGGTASADNATWSASNCFDDSDSTYGGSTNATTPHWLKYDLGSGVTKTATSCKIKSYSGNNEYDLYDFKMQGSNNDSDWTDLKTVTGETWTAGEVKTYTWSNTTAYRYYRIYITKTGTRTGNWVLQEVQFFESPTLQSYSESTIKDQGTYSLKSVATTGALNKTLTNTFSSVKDLSSYDYLKLGIRSSRTGTNLQIGITNEIKDFCTGGTATAGSYYGSRTPSRAFDNANTGYTADAWQSNYKVDWIKYDLGSGVTKTVKSYKISASTFPQDSPKDWKLYGSNNDSDWTEIDSVTDETGWSSKETRSFTCSSNTTAYRYYRLSVSACQSNSYELIIGEIEMFESTTTGGTTTYYNLPITSANTWETKTIDISSLTRNNVSELEIKVTNAGSANTFYLDEIRADTVGGGTVDRTVDVSCLSMTASIQSETVLAEAPVTVSVSCLSATFSVQEETVIAGSDVTADVSCLSASFAVQAETVSAETNVSPEVSCLSLTATLQAETVSAVQSPTVDVSCLSATFTVQDETVSIEQDATVSVSCLSASFSQQELFKSGEIERIYLGFREKKETADSVQNIQWAYSSPLIYMEDREANGTGFGYLFAHFPKSLLHGKKISIRWRTYHAYPPKDVDVQAKIYDGTYDRDDDTAFGIGSMFSGFTKGAGKLQDLFTHTSLWDETTETATVDLSSATEDYVTFVIGCQNKYYISLRIWSLDIKDTDDNLIQELWLGDPTMEKTGTYADYGIYGGDTPVLASVSCLASTFTLQGETVVSSGDCPVNVSCLEATFGLQSETVVAETNVAVDVSCLSASFAVQTETISVESNTIVEVSCLSASFGLQTETISAIQNVAVDVSCLSSSLTLQAETVSCEANITVPVSCLSATFSLETETVVSAGNVTVEVSCLSATFSVQEETASIDIIVDVSALGMTFTGQSVSYSEDQDISVSALEFSAGLQSCNVQTLGDGDVLVELSSLEATFTLQEETASIDIPVSVSCLSLNWTVMSIEFLYDWIHKTQPGREVWTAKTSSSKVWTPKQSRKEVWQE